MTRKVTICDLMTQVFYAVSVSPWDWHIAAMRLFHGASVIKEKCAPAWKLAEVTWPDNLGDEQNAYLQLVYPWCLLAGLSLEAMLKGIIIANNPSQYKPHKAGWTCITRTHDLAKLCQLAKVGKWTKAEKALMKVLTRQILWESKYPTPKKSYNMDATIPDPLGWFDLYQAMFDKVDEKYKSIGVQCVK